jgi:hypothetical protein
MAQQKKSEQTPIADANAVAWEDIVRKAKDVPQLYPKLKFGDDKLAEVTVDVLCEEETPRVVTFVDEFNGGQEGRAFVMNVQVLSGPEKGSLRALFMPANETHGLTRGVMVVAKNHGSRLKGIAMRIETKNYQNKRYKTKTRGYNVSEISAPAGSAP